MASAGRPTLVSALSIFLYWLTACTNTPPIPQEIDLFRRFTVNTVLVDGHRIAYVDLGTGPPVMLIHGFGGSMWQWEHQQIALSAQHRVITVDLLGSGLSDKPEINYSPTHLINFFRSFMEAIGVQKAALIGNSMGAGLAIGMALTYPEHVTKLVLIAGFPSDLRNKIASPKYKSFINYRPPVWLAKLGNFFAGRWATKSMLGEVVYNQDLLTPAIIERSYWNRSQPGFLRPLYSMLNHFDEWEKIYAARLPEIRQPTLILWGEEDRVLPIAVGRELHKTIPGSTFQEIAQTGHIPQWEKPLVVNPIILQFLADQ